MKLKFLPLLALLLFFAACKKNGDSNSNVTFPSKLYMSSVTAKGSVRVFANGAEVTNQTVINKFLNNNDKLFLNRYIPTDTSTIGFPSTDMAYFGFDSRTKYTVTKSNDQILFSKTMSNPISADDDILFGMLKYSSAVQLTPPNKYYSVINVVYGDYTNLTMSFFTYKLVKESLFLTEYSKVYNEFNADVASKLGALDTLAIQEYAVSYKAR